jgi:hypothetical protein
MHIAFLDRVRLAKTKNLLKKPLITLLLSIGLVGGMAFSSVSATTSTPWTGNGTTNGFCDDLRSDSTVAAGQQEWLFILTSPGTGPWSLTTSFSPAAQTPSNPISGVQEGGGSVHFTVTTGIGAKLLSASATNGTDNSVLTVSHCSYHAQLLVSKTASTTFTRDFDWTIQKSVDQNNLVLSPGQQQDVHYTVVVTKDAGTDSGWSVSGNIEVENTDPLHAANGVVVTDTLSGYGSVSVICPSTTIAAGDTMTCTYGPVAVPDGTSRTNTAMATTTTLGIDGGSGQAAVTFGAPTTVLDNCVNISDTFAGSLGNICASHTFTYTRTIVADNLNCGNNTLNNTASLVSDDGLTKTSSASVNVSVACVRGCTLTQGYWKTHSEFGPAPYDDTWALLSNGASTTFFSSGKTWYQVFWTAPAGNAYYILADQYMAAKLNMLNGASVPASVQTAFNQATTLLNTYSPAQVAAMKSSNSVRQSFINLAGILGSYNEGLTGPGHCSE